MAALVTDSRTYTQTVLSLINQEEASPRLGASKHPSRLKSIRRERTQRFHREGAFREHGGLSERTLRIQSNRFIIIDLIVSVTKKTGCLIAAEPLNNSGIKARGYLTLLSWKLEEKYIDYIYINRNPHPPQLPK